MPSKELEPFCFWCGGNARWDFQAEPRPFRQDIRSICCSCVAVRGNDIMLFELTEQDPGCGNPTLPGVPVYYTGRWVVIDAMTASMVFGPDKLLGVLASGIAGLRSDHYSEAGFDKYPWRTLH